MTTRQQMTRPKLRLVVSNPESATDWLIRVGPIAKELNKQSAEDR